MDFGSSVSLLLIACAILSVLGAVWFFLLRRPYVPLLPKARRHYEHTYHQPWWKALAEAKALLHSTPKHIGNSYFWENDNCRLRLSHFGPGYEGDMSITYKVPDFGEATESLTYTYGPKNRQEAMLYKLARGGEPAPDWVMYKLWRLYFKCTRKALVT